MMPCPLCDDNHALPECPSANLTQQRGLRPDPLCFSCKGSGLVPERPTLVEVLMAGLACSTCHGSGRIPRFVNGAENGWARTLENGPPVVEAERRRALQRKSKTTLIQFVP